MWEGMEKMSEQTERRLKRNLFKLAVCDLEDLSASIIMELAQDLEELCK